MVFRVFNILRINIFYAGLKFGYCEFLLLCIVTIYWPSLREIFIECTVKSKKTPARNSKKKNLSQSRVFCQ